MPYDDEDKEKKQPVAPEPPRTVTTPRRSSIDATLGSAFREVYRNPQDDSMIPDEQEPEEQSHAPSPQVMEERLQDYDTQSSLADSSLSGSDGDDSSGFLSGSSGGSISEDDSDAATGSILSLDTTLTSLSSLAGEGGGGGKLVGGDEKSIESMMSLSLSLASSDDDYMAHQQVHQSIRAYGSNLGQFRKEKQSGIPMYRSDNQDRCCTLVWDCCVYTGVFCCVLLWDSR